MTGDYQERQSTGETGHPLAGIRLMNENDVLTFKEEGGDMFSDEKLIDLPLGVLKFYLDYPTEDAMNDEVFDAPEGESPFLGDDKRWAVKPDGILFEDTIRNLVRDGYAGTNFSLRSDQNLIHSIPSINLWLEDSNFIVSISNDYLRLWGKAMPRAVTEAEIGSWVTPAGKKIDDPWVPIDPKFLSRLRINFESPRGGDVN